MHDPSLEQRLRAALQTEGDAIPFTITAAELERRLLLRRRGGLGPTASLGLAAAVGIGLLGLAGLVGGWFDTRPSVVPLPSASPILAVASPSLVATPSVVATPSAGLSALPSLDDLLAGVDPGRVVRSEAYGPYVSVGNADGEHFDPIDPGSLTFNPVATSGEYDVLAVCTGDGAIDLRAVGASAAEGGEVSIACNGARSVRQIGLSSGDALLVSSPAGRPWRVVLLRPDTATPHATAVADIAIDGLDADVAINSQSVTTVPSYAELQTGGGIETRTALGSVANRTRYDVYISCAGPTAVRYSFGGVRQADEPVDPGLTIDYVSGEVECDGTLQHDTIEVPLGDSEVAVTAEDRTAWRILVTTQKAPITLPADGNGWAMTSALGPDYFSDGQPNGFGLIGADHGGPVRVVVQCAGDGVLTGTIDVVSGARPEAFSLDCNGGQDPFGELTRTYPKGSTSVDLTFDAFPGNVWIAVTSQVRASSSPAP